MLTLHLASRRTFLKGMAALPLYSLTSTKLSWPLKRYAVKAAQLTAADGYGLGTYNEGTYPAQQQTIYLPLITKGA